MWHSLVRLLNEWISEWLYLLYNILSLLVLVYLISFHLMGLNWVNIFFFLTFSFLVLSFTSFCPGSFIHNQSHSLTNEIFKKSTCFIHSLKKHFVCLSIFLSTCICLYLYVHMCDVQTVDFYIWKKMFYFSEFWISVLFFFEYLVHVILVFQKVPYDNTCPFL